MMTDYYSSRYPRPGSNWHWDPLNLTTGPLVERIDYNPSTVLIVTVNRDFDTRTYVPRTDKGDTRPSLRSTDSVNGTYVLIPPRFLNHYFFL